MGLTVLHGIVDCLWVQGFPVALLKQSVENEIGILTEIEHFNWIVFPPINDGFWGIQPVLRQAIRWKR